MEARSKVKRAVPERYGFGVAMMKRIKVCAHCGAVSPVTASVCCQCREQLPRLTLFQTYQRRQPACPICDTLLADYMRYCPHCGRQLTVKEDERCKNASS